MQEGAARRSRQIRHYRTFAFDSVKAKWRLFDLCTPTSAEMYVLARLRDEAHRFAVTFHRNQRKRRTLRTALATIAGVGPVRQRALLRHFGSLRKVGEASFEELTAGHRAELT